MSAASTLTQGMRLSLPPTVNPGMPEVVGAPFAAPIIAAMLAAAPPGWLVAAHGVGEAAYAPLGRSCLGVDPDALALLSVTVQTLGPGAEEIASAFTRLLDAPYRGRPWGQHLQSLYWTSCPACWRPTTARAYHWQGAPPALIARLVFCENCGFDGEALVESGDRNLASEAEPGRLLHWEMMERVVPASDPLRSRAEQATQWYTSRNLWALWQSLRILRDLPLSTKERRALQLVLAQALWDGSILADRPDLLWQPTLRRPRRFVEHNLWNVLHNALQRVQAQSGSLSPRPSPATPDGEQERWYQLAQRWPAQDQDRFQLALDRSEAPQRAALALMALPPALPLYWLLRYAWTGWLFGPQAAAHLRDLLALRPGGGELMQRLVAENAGVLHGWLAPGGALAVQWRWRGDDDASAAVLAALPAASTEIVVAAAAEEEWIALAVTPRTESQPDEGPMGAQAVGLAALRTALLQRGEPATAPRLRPYVQAAWRRRGVSVENAAASHLGAVLRDLLDPLAPPPGLVVWGPDGDDWEPGQPAWWWLHDAPEPWLPASDAAERVARRLLRGQVFPGNVDALAWAVSLDLPISAAPDRPWVGAIVESYAVETAEGLTLRPADEPAARAAELATLSQELLAVGQRLGFDVAGWSESVLDGSGGDELWTVEWQREGRRRASFLITATTALTPRLWTSRAPIPGLSRYLVLPGSRAGLVQWRSDHQPLWAAAIIAGGWTFVKFRHLRELLADVDPDAEHWLFRLSLDPVTSARPEQMQLL